MATLAAPSYYERDGRRIHMVGGRSGIAEAMQTSPADETTPPETIQWGGTIGQLQVATGPNGGKHSVLRSRPLNVKMVGGGAGSEASVLRSMEVGESFTHGGADRANPAVHKLVWTDLTINVRASNGAYPIVTNVGTALGTFGIRRAKVLSMGTGAVVKTAVRGNASGRYVVRDIVALDGLQEYVVYCNAGAGESKIRNIQARDCGRGVVQMVYRSTENSFYTIEEDDGNSLLIEDIDARDCGAAGSSAVSVTGWADQITVRGLRVDSHWNTAAISLRYDLKQTELDKPSTPKVANVIGPGKLLASGHAHGSVVLDLEDSTIKTGVDIGGQASKSSRPAIMVDSCLDLWVLSDLTTRVAAGGGNLALHVEHAGAGAIRTQAGTPVGTRAVGAFRTSGHFGGWGSMARNGRPFSADEYLSARR